MKTNNVEDIYELSPLQQGMLFHCLYLPESGLYFEQVTMRLEGVFDISAFENAWRAVVDRNPILRTSFHWEGLEKPLQVVYKQVELPIEHHDWRRMTSTAQARKLNDYLREDRARGLKFDAAPLMRLALLRVSDRLYQFVWSFHHILLDGWSLPLLLEEFTTLYDAYRLRKQPQLETRRPFSDYIGWLQQQDLSRAESFWRSALAGYHGPTSLDVHRNGSNSNSDGEDFGDVSLDLSLDQTIALQALARQHQITLNTIVQGAWATILNRYSGVEDVVFGAVVSGRPAELTGVERMVGMFINTVPVRVRVRAEAELIPWLKELHAWQFEMRQYEYSPLVNVQGWSEVPRGKPLFNSILIFENYPVGKSSKSKPARLPVKQALAIERTNYPLSLIVGLGPELLLKLLFDSHLFDRETVAQLLKSTCTLLADIAANPQSKLRDLVTQPEDEHQRLVVDWNKTETKYPHTATIHGLFAEQLRKTPDDLAVREGDRDYTYAELDRWSNDLADRLRTFNVRIEEPVGILMDRSAGMIAAVLATLRTGAAYLPLDARYPSARLRMMATNARVRVIFTQKHLSALAEDMQVEAIDVSSLDEAKQKKTRRKAAPPVFAENVAHIIYTSGSTGVPKGVMGLHRNTINRCAWMWQWLPFAANERCAVRTSLNFVDSIWEIFGPLLKGVPLILIPDEEAKSPPLLVNALSRHSVTRLVLVPSLLRELLELEVDLNKKLPHLKYWSVSGEELPEDLLALFRQRLPDKILINLYGSSEVAADATAWLNDPNAKADKAPIGRPIANARVYVLDEHQRAVPEGVLGEVYVGGECLARGYLGAARLTAERFVPDPFSVNGGERLYRTGDVGRLRGGQLFYEGRVDRQVKVRGQRVELGEVEAAVRQIAGVRECAVEVNGAEGEQRLVAYVAGEIKGEREELAREWREQLGKWLPEHMVPAGYVVLEGLPQLPNGKLDRKGLREGNWGAEARGRRRERAAAETVTEQRLMEMWSAALGVEEVGAEDGFFELGGHSLMATRLVGKLREEFGVEVELRALFEAPTPRRFAAVLEQLKLEMKPAAPEIKPIVRAQYRVG